jgi:hypothetical protein
MTDTELKDTKDRILNVAEELFAKNGYSGTSIREIASIAKVNLSAINYHFTNKQALYWKTFENSYLWIAGGIEDIGKDEAVDTKELAWQTHRFLVKDGHHLVNTFRMFLSEDLPVDDDSFGQICSNEEGSHGPPGQNIFLSKITNEVGDTISFEGRHWAMRMIFSNIMDFSLKLSSPLFKKQLKQEGFLQPEEMKRSIYFLVEAVLEYLKKNPQNWQAK